MEPPNNPIPTPPEKTGVPLSEIEDVKVLQRMVEDLWDLLDWVDTMDDVLKTADDRFRKEALELSKKRFAILISDGYRLFKPLES